MNLPVLRIGSLALENPLLLAPLSGISNLPFRLLAKEQGCALVTTEMVSAEGLIRSRRRTASLLQSCPEERPLAVQIFGARPGSMAEAARIVQEEGADLVDINMGCPVRKVVRGGSGAALLKDLGRARGILQAVRNCISVPLTVKIRSGWDEKDLNYLEVARMAEECGVDALVLHARTRSQAYGGKADWQAVARVKEELCIPVIGNGDLVSAQAVVVFFGQTGCAGAMIGRGALGNPWIFRQALDLLQGGIPRSPSLAEKEAALLRHLEMMVRLRGEVLGTREFRKHLIWYTCGLRGNAGFRARIAAWKTPAAVAAGVGNYFAELRLGEGGAGKESPPDLSPCAVAAESRPDPPLFS